MTHPKQNIINVEVVFANQTRVALQDQQARSSRQHSRRDWNILTLRNSEDRSGRSTYKQSPKRVNMTARANTTISSSKQNVIVQRGQTAVQYSEDAASYADEYNASTT